MIKKSLFTALLFTIAFFIMGFGLPKNVAKKVVKEVEKTFEVEGFAMEAISISTSLNQKLPVRITEDNLFRLTHGERLLGYAFVDQAPSKTAKFDYLVVFDAELKVRHSKVLIYREEYGGEIGSKRWLKQFLGKTSGDRVSHESNIDGIAGATISVRSMTNAVDDLLQTISILSLNKVL